MSVITKESMDKKTYVGLRIAFAGCMASGKSFAAASVKKHIGKASIMSFSSAMKRMARGNIKFDNREGYQLVGQVGRQVDPEAWINILTKEILQMPPRSNIIVDDIRYENEMIALRAMGFVIVYMNTPWYTRLKRIQQRHEDDLPVFGDVVDWVTHESELQLETLPETIFDKVIVDKKELEEYIQSL